MTIIDTGARDLKLLTLLIQRALDEDACDASILATNYVQVVADRHDERRQNVEIRLDLFKRMPAVITDWRWNAGRRDTDALCRQAEEFANSISALWHERDNIKMMLTEVTATARSEVAKARRCGLQYRLISASVCPIEAGSTNFPYVHVQIERLGASLIAEIINLEFDDAAQVKDTFSEMRETQMARRMRQIVLHAAGADGEIDEVALRVMQLNGCDVPAILANLPQADHGILDVELPETTGRHVVLFWSDGVVKANVPLTETVHWREGNVNFTEVPKRFPAKPHGRLLSDFIQHEALPNDLRIKSGHRFDTSASAKVPVRMARFNSVTGQTWAA